MAQGLVGECEALLSSLTTKPDDLVAELDELKARKAQDAVRADRLERFGESYARNPSRRGRMILALSVTVATMLLVVGTVIYDSLNPTEITPRRLVYTMGGLAVAAVLGTFLGRKTLFANRIGEHLTSSIVYGFVCAGLLAVAGDRLGASGEAVMVGQMLIGSLAMANSYPIIGLGRWGAGFGAAMVLVSLILPDATHAALLATGSVGVGLLSYDWLVRDAGLSPKAAATPDPPADEGAASGSSATRE